MRHLSESLSISKHSESLAPGACKFCAIPVEEYYAEMQRRKPQPGFISPLTASANLLIEHYQSYLRRAGTVDIEMGVPDDLPSVPILKIEEVMNDDQPVQRNEREEDKWADKTTDVRIETAQRETYRQASGKVANFLSAIRSFPPTFVLGALVRPAIMVIILSGFVMSLYSRADELVLAFHLARFVLRWLSGRFTYDG